MSVLAGATGTCNITCPGNAAQHCGGHYAVSVYQLANHCVAPHPISSPEAEPTPEPCTTLPPYTPPAPLEECVSEIALRQIGPNNSAGISTSNYYYSTEFTYMAGLVTWVDTDNYGTFVGGCFEDGISGLWNVAGYWPSAPAPEWLPAGDGFDNCVYSLAYYAGGRTLYAGGAFTNAGMGPFNMMNYLAQARNLTTNVTNVQVIKTMFDHMI